eukprot:CAMPEP_0198441792 /NCGR_PEP_ID=MMETSP1452-20131203/64086_1 /TAXON_ID=1181717 /ORGANISM="Synchroma pusillum, Strain CCMP3072" /LENGTH=233 /DNA_ID=CAMNT_0044162419 /DNA_START=18 /DNA_END=716 /DNA_ORIENTATION=+
MDELMDWVTSLEGSLRHTAARTARDQRRTPPVGAWLDEGVSECARGLRTAAEILQHSSTKVALVVKPGVDGAALQSMLEEYRGALERLAVHYLSLCERPVGAPLLAAATAHVRGIAASVARLLAALRDGSVQQAPALTGMVWKECEALKTLPESNRGAYRRALMQLATAVKDTVREFAEVLQGRGDGGDPAVCEGGAAADAAAGGDVDDDGQDHGEGDEYGPEDYALVRRSMP